MTLAVVIKTNEDWKISHDLKSLNKDPTFNFLRMFLFVTAGISISEPVKSVTTGCLVTSPRFSASQQTANTH